MDQEQAPGQLGQLTDREKDLLRLVAGGKSITEIAAILNLHGTEALACRQAIMERLGIHSMAGLMEFAISRGLRPNS